MLGNLFSFFLSLPFATHCQIACFTPKPLVLFFSHCLKIHLHMINISLALPKQICIYEYQKKNRNGGPLYYLCCKSVMFPALWRVHRRGAGDVPLLNPHPISARTVTCMASQMHETPSLFAVRRVATPLRGTFASESLLEALDNMASSARRLLSTQALQPRVILSGIQPTGVPHLGNYVGALRQWVQRQHEEPDTTRLIYSVVDLHAITVPQKPESLRKSKREALAALLAIGIDPKRCTLFYQSSVCVI